MDDVQGTSLPGQGFTGTLMGGATQISTSVHGKALQLGGSKYVDLGNDGCLSQISLCPDTLTIAMYIYYKGEVGTKWASVFGNNGDMEFFILKKNSSHYILNLYCKVNQPTSTGYKYPYLFAPESADWMHIVTSCSSNGNTGNLHVNGEKIAVDPIAHSTDYGDGSRNVYLGKIHSSYTEPFWVDEVYIFYKELDAATIMELSQLYSL